MTTTPTNVERLHPPITMSPVEGQVAPHSYVVLKQTQICLHCNTTSEASEIFAKTHLKPVWSKGKYVTNLRPVRGPQDLTHNVPIETILRPPVRTPFCHECFDSVTLAHLPLPPPPPKTILHHTYADASNATEGSGTSSSLKRPKPTIDTLSDLV